MRAMAITATIVTIIASQDVTAQALERRLTFLREILIFA